MNRVSMLLLLAVSVVSRAHSQIQEMDRSWMQCHWTAKDDRFVAIRKEVEALAGNRPLLNACIASARKRCDRESATSEDLFRWASAVCERARGDWDFTRKASNDHRFRLPYYQFPKLGQNKSYEFTRTRFLFTTAFEFPHRTMLPMGEELLAREPNDLSVLMALCTLYQPQAYPEDVEKGLQVVGKLEEIAPHDLRIVAKTGYYYYKWWLKGHPAKYASEAIRRMKTARSLSQSPGQRAAIDQLMAEMRKKTADLGK